MYKFPFDFQAEVERWLPDHVRMIAKKFIIDFEKILEDAKEEGYTIIVGHITPGHYDQQDELVCQYYNDSIIFYSRQYYKGKRTNRLVRSRAGDKPAYYSCIEIVWFKDGTEHREHDKPAYLMHDLAEWCVNGKWHRSDSGPTSINGFRQEIKFHLNHDLYKKITPEGEKTWDISK